MANPAPKPKAQVALPLYATAIAVAREARGWSQSALGKKLLRSQQAVNALEAGDRMPPPALWPKLCRELDIDPNVFFQSATDGEEDGGLEGLIEQRQRRVFAGLHDRMLHLAREIGVAITAADLAYIIHNIWTRALLMDKPATLEERVDVLISRQRDIWQARRD